MATIQKRGSSFRIRVSNGYDSSGKQLFEGMTWKPPHNMTDRQIEKELNRIAVKFEESVKSGIYSPDTKIRLEEFCKTYISNVESRLSPTTLNSYKQLLKAYILPAMGNMRLKDIHPQHVQSFINNLQESGVRADDKPGKLAPSTIKKVYSVLQAILHNACKMDLIPLNPANSEKIELPAQVSPEVEIFTQEEAQAMMECLDTEPLMFQVLIILAVVTGCRRGELVALQWSDIDFKTGRVSISKSNYTLKGQGISTKSPKTPGSIRVITIPPFCLDLLKEYRIEQSETRLSIGDKWENGNWIFTQWNGKPMYPTTPTLWFDKFLKRHGLRHRKFHALRHTSATLLLVSGANIKTVGNRLGHHKLATTNRYVHAVESADVAAANAFQVMFSKKNDA